MTWLGRLAFCQPALRKYSIELAARLEPTNRPMAKTLHSRGDSGHLHTPFLRFSSVDDQAGIVNNFLTELRNDKDFPRFSVSASLKQRIRRRPPADQGFPPKSEAVCFSLEGSRLMVVTH
jgi:hypothetical protein